MATAPQAAPQVPPPGTEDRQEIRIVSHSHLFYWWPVWAVGFLMALLTYLDGHRMAIVPPGTEAFRDANVTASKGEGQKVTFENVDVLVVAPPSGDQAKRQHLLPTHPAAADAKLPPPEQPYMHVSENKGYGVLFAIVLLLVIVITNVPLRGLWSVVVIVLIVLGSIIFYLAHWWEPILDALGRLHVLINMAGYLVISAGLFIIWLVTFLLFDQQIYMVFTPGQLRVRQEIGGGEESYDTMGMSLQKQRNDLFRHWVLGLGSGDLIVNTSGANARHFDLPNVLFVGYKLKQIEEMLREKPVVRGQG
jgi:hypothetical protein